MSYISRRFLEERHLFLGKLKPNYEPSANPLCADNDNYGILEPYGNPKRFCGDRAEMGMCTTDKFVRIHCRKTCGLCGK